MNLQDVPNMDGFAMVKVCIKFGKIYQKTSECLVVDKKKLPQIYKDDQFFFLKYGEKAPTIYWLILNNKKYYHKFYCSSCNDVYNGEGSNVHSHISTFKHKTALVPKRFNPLDSYILWSLKHCVSSNSMKDDLFHSFVEQTVTFDAVKKRMEEMYNCLIQKISTILQTIEKLVVIADGWTDKRCRRYLGIAVRYFQNGTIHHIFLGLADIIDIHHTSEAIADSIFKHLAIYKVRKEQIISLCTDSAPVMIRTAKIMKVCWDQCFIHTFNKTVEEFIKTNKDMSNILHKANLATKKEVFVSFLEMKHAPISSIKTYSETRWMSCAETFNSIVILKDYIIEYNETGHEALLTKDELVFAETIQPYIEQLNEAYELLLNQETCVFSSIFFRVISTIVKLIYTIDAECPLVSFQDFKQLIFKKFLNPSEKPCRLIINSMILDKSHKIPDWFLDSEEYELSVNLLQAEIDKLKQKESEVEHHETENQTNQVVISKGYDINKSFEENMRSEHSDESLSDTDYSELINFLNRKKTKKCFIDFWTSEKTRNQYPTLYKYTNDLMMHSFTTLYIERCFSQCKRILNNDRLTTTKENSSMLATMKLNLDLLYSICSLGNNL